MQCCLAHRCVTAAPLSRPHHSVESLVMAAAAIQAATLARNPTSHGIMAAVIPLPPPIIFSPALDHLLPHTPPPLPALPLCHVCRRTYRVARRVSIFRRRCGRAKSNMERPARHNMQEVHSEFPFEPFVSSSCRDAGEDGRGLRGGGLRSLVSLARSLLTGPVCQPHRSVLRVLVF